MSSALMQKLRGTSEVLFRFANSGPQLRAVFVGVGAVYLEARNAIDSAYTNVRGADPVIPDDLATKRYVDSVSGGTSGEKFIAIDMTGTTGPTKTSVTVLPNGARVTSCVVTPVTAEPGTFFTIGNSTTPNLVMDTADSDLSNTANPSAIGTQNIPWVGAFGVTVFVSGTIPSAPGTYARILVGYVESPQA